MSLPKSFAQMMANKPMYDAVAKARTIAQKQFTQAMTLAKGSGKDVGNLTKYRAGSKKGHELAGGLADQLLSAKDAKNLRGMKQQMLDKAKASGMGESHLESFTEAVNNAEGAAADLFAGYPQHFPDFF